MRMLLPTASSTSTDLGLAQLPGPRDEGIGLRGQRADRAQIDDVGRQFGAERALDIGADLHVLAAPGGAQFLDAGDIGQEADAARAVDAARHAGLDQRAEILVAHRALVLVIAAAVEAIGHRLVLQIALAALVADRAIERMVDQQELHHALARLVAPFPTWVWITMPSATGIAQEAIGFGERSCSTRHMRQLPAIARRS